MWLMLPRPTIDLEPGDQDIVFYYRAQFWDLPQETINQIVDSLEDDTDALRACASAHRCMTWAAQRILHRALDWKFGKGRRRSENMYSRPALAACVRELRLRSVPDFQDSAWQVMTRFTRLEVLTLSLLTNKCHWDMVQLTTVGRDFFRKMFPNVTSLTIAEGLFSRVQDFLFFLSAFPNVTTLKISNVRFNEFGHEYSDTDELQPSPPSAIFPEQVLAEVLCPNLRHLDLSFRCLPTEHCFRTLLRDWLAPLAQVAQPGFKLKWYNPDSDDTYMFPTLVRTFAPVLSSLEVTLPDSAMSIADFGVENCTRLETISFVDLCRRGYYFQQRAPNGDGWALKLLAQIKSQHLKTVMLGFTQDPRRGCTDMFNFRRLKRTLLRPEFAHTQVLIGPCCDVIWDMLDRNLGTVRAAGRVTRVPQWWE